MLLKLEYHHYNVESNFHTEHTIESLTKQIKFIPNEHMIITCKPIHANHKNDILLIITVNLLLIYV